MIIRSRRRRDLIPEDVARIHPRRPSPRPAPSAAPFPFPDVVVGIPMSADRVLRVPKYDAAAFGVGRRRASPDRAIKKGAGGRGRKERGEEERARERFRADSGTRPVQLHQRCAFTVDVKECRMSDGCSAIGHATGVRAIVRGCDRANAQGAGKSVMYPDGNALSLGRGGRFVMPGAGGGHGGGAP